MKLTDDERRELRNALIEMVIRYSATAQKCGRAGGTGVLVEGRSLEFWSRARERQFMAIQRLASALRDAGVSR